MIFQRPFDVRRGLRRYLRLLRVFIAVSLQEAFAYRADFATSVLHSLLHFGTGLLGLLVLFGQVDAVRGWTFPATLAVLGVYLTAGGLRKLVISPSLDALAGMDGAVWQGTFDFTLLRPVDVQFMASARHWRPLALLDLLLGAGVLATAVLRLGESWRPAFRPSFLLALAAAVTILYAILLAFTGLVFWSPGFLFTWLFDGLFQMARYPTALYPGALSLVLTWIIPIGLITTVPAQALAGELPPYRQLAAVLFALALLVGASWLFRAGVRRYASASS